jgi:ABC-2 type transport system permease protein
VKVLQATPEIEVLDTASASRGRTALRRGELDAVMVLPADLDANVAAGRPSTIAIVAERANTAQLGAYTALANIVQHHGNEISAARFAVEHAGGALPQRLEMVRRIEPGATPVQVHRTSVDAGRDPGATGFNYSAPTMLVLFVFINALSAASAMISTRDQGLFSRILAAPVRPRAIVAAETLSYLTLAVGQSALIVLLGAVAFGVHWGDPLAVTLLVVTWSLVGTGAGVLAGTVFRTPEQATSIGPPLGIMFGMLGGCMWPLEIVGSAMRTLGHLTPHAWAVDAWTAVVAKGATVGDIASDLGVLLAFAAGLLIVATVRMRRSLLT